jgi:hypothetical protein
LQGFPFHSNKLRFACPCKLHPALGNSKYWKHGHASKYINFPEAAKKGGEYIMQLLTKELLKRFEKVGRQEEVSDPIVIAKFFNPAGAGTWYATEYDPEARKNFSATFPSLATGTMNGDRLLCPSLKTTAASSA